MKVTGSIEKQKVWWETAVFVSTILIISYGTLFPFDFIFVKSRFILDWNLFSYYAARDFPPNVLLFVPFGYSMAVLLARWLKRPFTIVWLTSLLGFLFSLLIEYLQTYLDRFPSAADILANTIGTIVGIITYLIFGAFLFRWIQWAKQKTSPGIIGLGIVLYLGGLFMATWLVEQAVSLDSWDNAYPLVLGNELTGDRPWQGTVLNLFATDVPLSDVEINRIMSGETPLLVLDKTPITFYALNDETGLHDQIGNSAPFVWQGNGRLGNNTLLSQAQWLATSAPVATLSEQVKATTAFTIGALVTPGQALQYGPARIISISTDPYHRNMTIGQEGDDLVIRMRTRLSGENGRKPQLVIPDVFADNVSHQFIITYHDQIIRTFVDDIEHVYTFKFTPPVMLFWVLTPIETTQIRLSAVNTAVFQIMYISLILVPLLLSLPALQKKQNITTR